MELQERLERDLKTALLSGDKRTAETLKGLKNALQYEAVSLRIQKSVLTEEQILQLLSKESKKRQEAAELYQKAGEKKRAEAELAEKRVIEQYLPAQLSETEISSIIDEEISKIDSPSLSDMGRVIGQVKNRLGAQADGAVIAKLAKQSLESR